MGVRRKASAAVVTSVGAAMLIAAQTGTAARAATTPVQAGVASAGAALIGVSPGVSGLTLTTIMGEADAAYEETQSEATSATVDLGGLGYYLANEPFCGQTFPEKDQPQPLKANSGDGASSPSSGIPGVGQEQVSVNSNPEEAQATTSVLSESLPGILTVTGVSVASVHYQANTEQEADSTVTADITILGGLVDLDGATWSASRHAGATEITSGNFNLGKVTIHGIPLSRPDLPTGAAVAAINQAIGALGFTLTLPAVTSGAGAVAVGPLVLRFSGGSAERTAVNPVIPAITNLEGEMNANATPGSDCSQFSELLYNLNSTMSGQLNLALAISRGAGSVNFDLGGVNAAVTDLPAFSDPFSSAGSGTNPLSALPQSAAAGSGPAAVSDASGGSAGGLALGGSGVSVAGLNSGGGSAAGGAGATTRTAPGSSALRPVATSCRTTSPAGSPGCGRGPASVAGILLLAGGGAVMAADAAYGHRRRRRRRNRGRLTGTVAS